MNKKITIKGIANLYVGQAGLGAAFHVPWHGNDCIKGWVVGQKNARFTTEKVQVGVHTWSNAKKCKYYL